MQMCTEKGQNVHGLPADLPGDRRGFFRMVLRYLQSVRSFNELQAKCIEINELPNFKGYTLFVDKNINMVTYNLTADGQAMNFILKDVLHSDFTSWFPVQIMGDGNCLPRSASVACFGKETDHQEIRARIVIEMCLHMEKYTDNEYLNRGIDLPKKEVDNLVKTYTMFSEQYTVGDKITNAVINRIYQAEALEVVKNEKIMGIWQLFALSSCLKSVVNSIYPDFGPRLPKLTLNRKILPRANLDSLDNQEKFVVMWSSTRTDMTRQNWIPNHFVPLIRSYQSNIDFLDDNDEEDGFALDDGVMITLLQTVTDVTFDDGHYCTNELADDTGTGDNIIIVDVDRPWSGDQTSDVGSKTATAQLSDVSATTSGDQLLEFVSTTDEEQPAKVSLNDDQPMVDGSTPEAELPTEFSALNDDMPIIDSSTTEAEPPSVVSAMNDDQPLVDGSTPEAEQLTEVSARKDDQPMIDGSMHVAEQLTKVPARKDDQPMADGSTPEAEQPNVVSVLNDDQPTADGSTLEAEPTSEVSVPKDDRPMVDGFTTVAEPPSAVSALNDDMPKVDGSTTEAEPPSLVSAMNDDQPMIDGSMPESEQLTEVLTRKDDQPMVDGSTPEAKPQSEFSVLKDDQPIVDGSIPETEQPPEVSAQNDDQPMIDGSTPEAEQPIEVSARNDNQPMIDGFTTDADRPSEVSAMNDDQPMIDKFTTQTTKDSAQVDDKEIAVVAMTVDVNETEKMFL